LLPQGNLHGNVFRLNCLDRGQFSLERLISACSGQETRHELRHENTGLLAGDGDNADPVAAFGLSEEFCQRAGLPIWRVQVPLWTSAPRGTEFFPLGRESALPGAGAGQRGIRPALASNSPKIP
jgi:hypothetical protein